MGRSKVEKELTRRGALGIFTGLGAAFAFACSGKADGSSTSNPGDGGAEAGACAVSPEGEIGPYFSDDSDPRFNRTSIVTNIDGTDAQDGIPLTLTITVLDVASNCVPYANAQVDIWHCNSAGIYSDQAAENTASVTWLRGYQITGANGQVTFHTVIPGWYQGRTTHVHLRVRSTYSSASSLSDGTNTTQLFFDQALVDSLATTAAPYSAEGKNATTNASDHVFTGETKGANVLALSGDDETGYVASVTIGIPIAAATSSGTGAGPG